MPACQDFESDALDGADRAGDNEAGDQRVLEAFAAGFFTEDAALSGGSPRATTPSLQSRESAELCHFMIIGAGGADG